MIFVSYCSQFESSYNPGQFVDLLYGQRMRSATERNKVGAIYLCVIEQSRMKSCHAEVPFAMGVPYFPGNKSTFHNSKR